MKSKEIIITIFITILTVALCSLNYIGNKYFLKAESVYKVYLDGKIVGYIQNDEELYQIISNRQKEIRNKYNVKKVYPPESFKIVQTKSYNVSISSAEQIYETLAKLESFAIDGYIINIKDKEDKKQTIYVLDREIFDKAVNNLVLAFITEEQYENYVNNTQPMIETTGKIIERMYFDETITIKKGYIDVKEQIFTDETEISQYMLFGPNAKMTTYTVKAGDTIESVSDDNKLNPQEFLVANPKYTTKDSLLKIGEEVNVTLINPILTLSYEVHEVSDAKIQYDKKVVYDSSQPADYSEITTPGVTGISRMTTKYVVKNGEMQSGVVTVGDPVTIVEKVDEVTTKGGTPYTYITGTYVDTGSLWGWPTNSPYVLTSDFGYRWGTLHEGIDISGTGHGSPIYSVLEGTVYNAGWEIPLCNGGGYCVIIEHPNGYYTLYAHMSAVRVKKGETVSRGQIVGAMGATGYATGTHLHFGIWYGVPYATGSKLMKPLDVIG